MGENEVTDKGLISKIYNHLLQLKTKKINNPIKKWAEDLNSQLSQEDTLMTNKTHEKMSDITNANHNYYGAPIYTIQNGHHQKVYKQ